jgi:putative cell wall-binding protein
MAQKKLRIALASLAAGAMACSSLTAFADVDSNSINIDDGWYKGRIAGADRFQTAARAAQSLSLDEASRTTVVLANAYAWSDVLAATPLADELNTTVLYTNKDSFPKATADALKSLKAKGVDSVVIVGGTAVVSQSVVDQLAGLGFVNKRLDAAGVDYQYQVDRVAGADRYETALLLAADTVDQYAGVPGVAAQRKNVARLSNLEAEFQAATKALEAARAKTAAALDDVAAKTVADAAARAALKALTDQLVVEGNIAALQETASAKNNAVVVANNKVLDIQTVQGYVNAWVSEYVNAAADHFQDDEWADVVDFFGSRNLSVTLSSGTYSGTLADLSTTLPYLQDASTATGSVQAVGLDLVTLLAEAKEQQTTAVEEAGAANLALQNAINNSAANSALRERIAQATKAVNDAAAALVKAQNALTAAQSDEANAQVALTNATENRPSTKNVVDAKKAYEDAVAAALAAGKEHPAFLATGLDFADALAAGPAAAKEDDGGVVLLTNGSTVPASTARYLASNPNVVGVGGPAATAALSVNPKAVTYVGKDRYQTATKLAGAYFDSYDNIGLASGQVAADAVVAGAVMANVDSTLVLTQAKALPKVTDQFLAYDVDGAKLVVFGGKEAISDAVVDAAERAVEKR